MQESFARRGAFKLQTRAHDHPRGYITNQLETSLTKITKRRDRPVKTLVNRGEGLNKNMLNMITMMMMRR